MTFLTPWALAFGGLGAAGVVFLHLVSHQRPAAFVLPTTRFIPDEQTLVSRVATSPRDLLLLLLRVLLLLSAAAAFARPVLTPSRGAMARIIVVDQSYAVASAAEASARVKALLAGTDIPSTVVVFDSSAKTIDATGLDSLPVAKPGMARGSLTTALIVARQASIAIADRADSIQLVLVSPVTMSEIDSATRRIRALWPGAIQLERIAQREDSSIGWALERLVPMSDPLGPAVSSLVPVASRRVPLTRVVRGALSADDSTFARNGGTVVRWDSTAVRRPKPEGLSVGGEVVVAALQRLPISPSGAIVGRWADGAPAVTENALASGCIRDVGVAMPVAGDLALHPTFQRVIRHVLTPCGYSVPDVPADSMTLMWLRGSVTHAASGEALRSQRDKQSPLAKWLLAFAMVCAFAELFVRTRSSVMETG